GRLLDDQAAVEREHAYLTQVERQLIDVGMKTRAGVFRWPSMPCLSVAASLAYLADSLAHLYVITRTMLSEQWRDRHDRLPSGSLDLALSTHHEATRAIGALAECLPIIIEDYRKRYPMNFLSEQKNFEA